MKILMVLTDVIRPDLRVVERRTLVQVHRLDVGEEGRQGSGIMRAAGSRGRGERMTSSPRPDSGIDQDRKAAIKSV